MHETEKKTVELYQYEHSQMGLHAQGSPEKLELNLFNIEATEIRRVARTKSEKKIKDSKKPQPEQTTVCHRNSEVRLGKKWQVESNNLWS